MLVDEDVSTLECLPYLFEQPFLPLVYVDFRDLTTSKKLKMTYTYVSALIPSCLIQIKLVPSIEKG